MPRRSLYFKLEHRIRVNHSLMVRRSPCAITCPAVALVIHGVGVVADAANGAFDCERPGLCERIEWKPYRAGLRMDVNTMSRAISHSSCDAARLDRELVAGRS